MKPLAGLPELILYLDFDGCLQHESVYWHHAAISSAYVPEEDLPRYLKCFNCGASSQDFVLAVGSEAPPGTRSSPRSFLKRTSSVTRNPTP